MGPKRVLIVDDDDDMRQLLSYILGGEDYQIQFANNGGTAIAMLEKEPFDVVVSDIRMPSGDGFFLLREIRKRWAQIRVILVSGYVDRKAVQKYRQEYGDFLYLPKIECPMRLGALVNGEDPDERADGTGDG